MACENKQKLNECRLLKRFGDELVFSYHNNRRPDARSKAIAKSRR